MLRRQRRRNAACSVRRHSLSATRCSLATTGWAFSQPPPRQRLKEDFMADPICVVTGVGPGTGSSVARRFAKGGYRVALLARDRQRLAALQQELAGAKAYPCDA